MKQNSHKIMPSYLKSEFIKDKPENKGKSLESVRILKRSDGEYRISANSDVQNKISFIVSQDYPDGGGGGAFIYQFRIGSNNRISLVQILAAGGGLNFK